MMFTSSPLSLILLSIVIFARSSNEEKCRKDMNYKLEPELPTLQVNLDLPPKERWNHIVVMYREPLNELIDHLKGYVGKYAFNLLEWTSSKVSKHIPKELQEEMDGISTAIEMKYSDVVLYNIFYEIFTVCTSIIAVNPENNEVIHGRNLDFGIFMGRNKVNHTWKVSEILKKLVFNVEWTRDGKVIANSVNFAGYIGVLTGMKENAFSFTLNERFTKHAGIFSLIKIIMGKKEKGRFTGFVARDVVLNAQSYDEAVETLKNVELLATVYFIVGSPDGQGIVITRDKKKTYLENKIDAQNNIWYQYETNYDRNGKAPFFDNRRGTAVKCMNEYKVKDGDSEKLKNHIFNVLGTKPVLNQLTVYATIMSSKTGFFHSSIQTCEHPCPLF